MLRLKIYSHYRNCRFRRRHAISMRMLAASGWQILTPRREYNIRRTAALTHHYVSSIYWRFPLVTGRSRPATVELARGSKKLAAFICRRHLMAEDQLHRSFHHASFTIMP